MGAIRDFVETGVKEEDSYLRDVTYRFWKSTGAKAAKGERNTWIRAVLYKCTGMMNIQEAIAEWNKDDSFMPVLNEVATSMLEREDSLEKGVAWKRVLSASTEEEQLDALDEFMEASLEWYRKKCIDGWRNTEGTFSYYYRRAQVQLRENLDEAGWSVYEPKSRYYGPAGLIKPQAIDIQDEKYLDSIPVTEEIMSNAKRIFYREPLTNHAKYFHGKVDDTSSVAVAIRNLVRWLCYKYDLLQTGIGLDNTELASNEDTAKKAQLQDLEKLARKAVSLMGEKEKKILLMRLQGMTGEEIAEKLELSGPSHVSYYMGKIRRLMRDIKSENAAMNGAVDEDSEYGPEDASELERAFTECFVKSCEG